MKRVSRQSAIGETGVAFIAERIAEMGHIWHPTSAPDSGVDGEMELRDPATGVVRNVRIGVQSKATEGRWRSETADGFLFRAKPDDIEYWLSSNQPVLVVCVRARTEEAYWRNIQEWAKDPKVRASGLIDFDKRRDVFNVSAAARFFVVQARDVLMAEPPGPDSHPERAKINLLPVRWTAERIWSVPAPSHEWRVIFQRALQAEVPRTDVALRSGQLWSLVPFSEDYLAVIGAEEEPTDTPLIEISGSSDFEDRTLLAELARRSLLEQYHRDLRWCPPERVAYFKLFREGRARKLAWSKGRGRTVVLPRPSRQHGGLSGYRHEAARLGFRAFDTGWFLAVNPTYLFTLDGRKISSFHADAVKKMKEIDRAAAVSQQLRMWEWLFTRPATVMDTEEERPFQLGHLVEVSVPVRAPEGAWKKAPSDLRGRDADEDHSEDQIPLFDSLDES